MVLPNLSPAWGKRSLATFRRHKQQEEEIQQGQVMGPHWLQRKKGTDSVRQKAVRVPCWGTLPSAPWILLWEFGGYQALLQLTYWGGCYEALVLPSTASKTDCYSDTWHRNEALWMVSSFFSSCMAIRHWEVTDTPGGLKPSEKYPCISFCTSAYTRQKTSLFLTSLSSSHPELLQGERVWIFHAR